ncbi:4-hydroxy-2-oxoglutarate aldolase, mitochondrial-like isoform X2 [Sipha flava]|uniref:4-hydroxy-2-oxoglutarate aldolase, mitochondrial-like isoform X2 n=1 Tax=Sipha flava TaxID=143950 RepID=A0A2S2QQ51_9HEMI|nr:4-hydroxy-2-oxoglutarate aldolase, mitochondrial-like isoform X2 [Sipha flava]
MYKMRLLSNALGPRALGRRHGHGGRGAAGFDLGGVFVPIPTPYQKNGDVDYGALAANFQRWEKIPFRGYCVGGSNGEGPYLSADEKIEMVSKIRSMIGNDRLLIAGTTCESTKLTCDLSKAAAEVGADGVLVMSPFYFKTRMTEDSLYKHFVTLADSCPAPVIVYNMVPVTGIDLSIGVLKKMAAHPNIVGVKDKDMAKLAALVTETRNLQFQVVAGSASYLLAAMLVGCSGGINGLAAVLGEPLCKMHALAMDGQWQKALELQRKLVNIDLLLMQECGPAGLKAAMELLGYSGGACRSPLPPICDEKVEKIKRTLEEDGFL